MKKLFLFMTLLACVFETESQVLPEPHIFQSKISGPELELSADTLFYGSVRATATTRKFVNIINSGDELLQLSHILFSDEGYFYLDQRDTLPIFLEPGDSTRVGIWFQPGNDQQYNATISFISNDPEGIVLMHASGKGVMKDWPIGEVFWTYTIEGDNDPGPNAIIGIQDVTGDQIEDVIICSQDNIVRCFNGNADSLGDLIWQTEITSGPVLYQNALATIPDINNDSYEDITIGTCGEDKSIITLSGYTGQQIWKHQTNEFGNGGNVFQLATTYDYNDDDFPDVLAATGNDANNTGPKRAYCLNGLTGDSLWTCVLDGPVLSVIGIEDFTGDGKPDALAGTTNETDTEGSFYAIDGVNGNDKWRFVTPAKAVWALGQIDDINENGTKDIIAGLDNGQYYMVDPKTLFILKTSSIGNFNISRMVVINDISRDFYKDVLIASDAKRAIVIDGANAGYLVNEPIADQCLAIDQISDLDGDEQNDFIAGSSSTSNYAYFFETYTDEVLFETNYETPLDAIKSIKDINNDLSMEMVVGGRNGNISCLSGGLNATVGVHQNYVPDKSTIVHGSFPNPFSNETNIVVELASKEKVIVRVYDSHGGMVQELQNRQLPAGQHSFRWKPASTLSKGIYFYNISTHSFVVTGKLVLLK